MNIQGPSLGPWINLTFMSSYIIIDNDFQVLAIGSSVVDLKNHKGYGTKAHKVALQEYGITKHHRKSYKPVAELIK